MDKKLRWRPIVFWQNIVAILLIIGFWVLNWYFVVYKPLPGLHPDHLKLVTPPLAMALIWCLLTVLVRTFWLKHAVMFVRTYSYD